MERHEHARWQVGDVILDNYRVDALLGEGGMGEVYLVRDRLLSVPFAVKRSRLEDPRSRRRFMEELLTWIDLPEHRNIVPCRFFRSVDDEVTIFADYAGGGALTEWIRGGRVATLERILDFAIQLAWGLHAAHEAGVVHQDVKPANVLMDAQGTPAVSDFGLAQARASIQSAASGGMTPAYCSPEQARREPVGRTTDVWSFGLCVVEMFAGQCFWMSGVAASDVLTALMSDAAGFAPVVAMPGEIAGVLERCFLPVAQRWCTMIEVAEALVVAFGRLVGRPYERQAPLLAAPGPRSSAASSWQPPLRWLENNGGAAGLCDAPPPIDLRADASLKSRAIADLVLYDALAGTAERSGALCHPTTAFASAGLFYQKATLHEYLDDLGGALQSYDTSLSQLARATSERAEDGAQRAVVAVARRKADVVRRMGQLNYAIRLARWVAERSQDPKERGGTRLVEARALRDLGDHVQASSVFASARADLQQASRYDREAAALLPECLVEAADLFMAPGELDEAVPLYREAVRLLEDVSGEAQDTRAKRSLAVAYAGHVKALAALGEQDAALDLCARAMKRLEDEAAPYRANDVVPQVARILLVWASLMKQQTTHAAALATRGVELSEMMVFREGRLDLARDLVDTYLEAVAVLHRTDARASIEYCDRAIRVLEGFGRSAAGSDLLVPLAEAHLGRRALLRRYRGAGIASATEGAVDVLLRLMRETNAHWLRPLVFALSPLRLLTAT